MSGICVPGEKGSAGSFLTLFIPGKDAMGSQHLVSWKVQVHLISLC